MRPLVLLDMDGPLADFDTAIWEAISAAKIPLSCTRETQTVRYIADAAGKEHQTKVRDFVNAAGFFASLSLVEGAKEGISALSAEAEVWICTKPLETNPTCRDEKAAWINRHLGRKWEERLIFAPDKSLVMGSILLDDAPKPKWYRRATWKPVIYPTVWNGVGSVWSGLPRWDWTCDPQFLLTAYDKNRPDFKDVPLPLFTEAEA